MHSAKIAIIIVVTLLSDASVVAQTAPSTQPGMASRAQRDALIARAQQRMAKDRQKYTAEQLAECEQLYQVANRNWRSDEAAAALNEMIRKFPDTNRTGCGALYLAQYWSGEEQQRQLKQVIEKYSDCRYGNGVQVGAFARLLLAGNYWQSGQRDLAQELFEEINRDYPGAITHRGILISHRIKEIQAPDSATQPTRGGY